jgi:hypothetical protein
MEDSAKLAAYRYRRPRSRQSNTVLVNSKMHADARAAVEAVLGPVVYFVPVEKSSPRRSRRRRSALDVENPSVVDFNELFGIRQGPVPDDSATPEVDG